MRLGLEVMLVCISIFAACVPRSLSTVTPDRSAIALEALADSAREYHYFEDYEFVQMRLGRGSHFLQVRFDSAMFFDSTQMLCFSGQVMQYGDTVGIQGAQVVVGTVIRYDGQITSARDSSMPRPIDYFEIIPQYEDTTDSNGRFALCAEIGSTSSLLIANKGFQFYLYRVGNLADSSRTP